MPFAYPRGLLDDEDEFKPRDPRAFKGQMSAYDPTIRERATDWINRNIYGDTAATMPQAEYVTGLAEMTPFGLLTGAQDLSQGLEAGSPSGIAGGLLAMGLPGPAKKGAKGVTKGIRAYHGSPHDFEKFSMGKIGTGEGAQAYGHGLYFAENEGVARDYRNKLQSAALEWPTKRQEKLFAQLPPTVQQRVNDYILKYRPNPKEVRTYFENLASGAETSAKYHAETGQSSGTDYGPDRGATAAQIARAMLAEKKLPRARDLGKMYEVEIGADPEHFLDWDKPLSQQPHIAQKLGYSTEPRNFEYEATLKPGSPEEAAYYAKIDKRLGAPGVEDITGEAAIRAAATKRREGFTEYDYSAATEQMRQAGIPGIRYLDQGSRAGGEGTSNYVVFDENLINILRKYGIAGLLGTGTAGAAMQPDQAQARPY